MGGHDVARYALHFSPSLETLLTSPSDTSVWAHGSPFTLSAGIETTFTLDFNMARSLLDQPLYFILLAYPFSHDSTPPGPMSNYIRIFMPSPPPPPPPIPTDSIGGIWNSRPGSDYDDGSVIPRIAQADFRLELILPIVGGVLLLMICLGIYCYFCVVRRKHQNIQKGKQTILIFMCLVRSVGAILIRSPLWWRFIYLFIGDFSLLQPSIVSKTWHF